MTQPIAPAPETSLARRAIERVSDVGPNFAKGAVGQGESSVGAVDQVTGSTFGIALSSVAYDPALLRDDEGEDLSVDRLDQFSPLRARIPDRAPDPVRLHPFRRILARDLAQ